jgi:hypothetical protein
VNSVRAASEMKVLENPYTDMEGFKTNEIPSRRYEDDT